jgi:8-oxo-dGTP pyrophosphatase MutT (NUDIX family)
MKKISWKKVRSTYVLQNPWYSVRQDEVIRPDGNTGVFNVVECGKSVFILPVTEEGKILLVHLYRYPTQNAGWELPAGGVEAGETPLRAAKRELQEETGRKAENWQSVGMFESMNGMTDATAHVFIAKGLMATSSNEKGEEGITRVKAFTVKEIMNMIAEEKIVDALTIASLMRAQVKASFDG